jgi:hypothetical protein
MPITDPYLSSFSLAFRHFLCKNQGKEERSLEVLSTGKTRRTAAGRLP